MRRTILGVSLALALIGCAGDPRLTFDSGGIALPVEISQTTSGKNTRYLISIDSTIAPRSSSASIRLELVGDFGSADLAVGSRDNSYSQASISRFADTDPLVYHIPLPEIDRFDTIFLDVDQMGENFAINRIGIDNRSFGLSLGESRSIDTGIDYSHRLGNPHSEYSVGLSRLLSHVVFRDRRVGVELRYRYTGRLRGENSGPRTIQIEMLGDERIALFELLPQGGGGSVYFYDASMGVVPETMRIISHDPGFTLLGVRLFPVGLTGPIPADFGAIFAYDSSAWRLNEYELFRWNLFPSILIFDTISYEIQAAFFKRLAFFVEKRGYAGQVRSNRELENLHGWNAHDYRSTDLAEFFNAASGVELNREELVLRRILLEEGIIRRMDRGFAPGDGGVISISQESIPILRDLFLLHEGYHGLFFADDGFRNKVFQIWADLDESERLFWRRFLANRAYNPDDEYLMINEFQSYLLQQPLDEVDSYFHGFAVPRFRIESPAYVSFVNTMIEEFPDTFMRAAEQVAKAAFETAGISAGSLNTLHPR